MSALTHAGGIVGRVGGMLIHASYRLRAEADEHFQAQPAACGGIAAMAHGQRRPVAGCHFGAGASSSPPKHASIGEPGQPEQELDFTRVVDVAIEIADIAVDVVWIRKSVVHEPDFRALLVREVAGRLVAEQPVRSPDRGVDVDLEHLPRRCLHRLGEGRQVRHREVGDEPAARGQVGERATPGCDLILQGEQV